MHLISPNEVVCPHETGFLVKDELFYRAQTVPDQTIALYKPVFQSDFMWLQIYCQSRKQEGEGTICALNWTGGFRKNILVYERV